MQHVSRHGAREDEEKRMRKTPEYTASEFIRLNNEYVHNSLYRQILYDRFVDGLTLEQIAEKNDRSVTRVKTIIYKYGDMIIRKLGDGR